MNHTTVAFTTKLKKLEQQINIARLSDFSYPDAQDALDILRSRLKHRASQIGESESFSAPTRNAILRDVNYLMARITAIIGIIVRSASVRNAFELYAPFLELCKSLVSEDARLILSSEWEYVPFTYPQNLVELPEFIVIGLPASESENVLIFPAAGHELGHSVWAKQALADDFKERVEHLIDEAFRRKRPEFENLFPDLKGADLDQDMFVQHIKAAVFSSAMSQAEETFSDFLGLVLFGKSYLLAFEYLIAPQTAGGRTKEYPDIHERASMLERFARESLGVDVPDYATAFMPDTPFRMPHDNFICSVADEVMTELQQEIFASVRQIANEAKIPVPTVEGTNQVIAAFERGVPYDGSAALGDLINAGWHVFRAGETQTYSSQGRIPIEYISDLILKSAEIHEIGRTMA